MPFQSQWQQYTYNTSPAPQLHTSTHSSGSPTIRGASIPPQMTRTIESFVVQGNTRPPFPSSLTSPRGQGGHGTECWNNQRMSLWNNYTSACLARVAELRAAGYPGPYGLPLGIREDLLPRNGYVCPCSGRFYRMKLDVKGGSVVAYWA